MERPITLALAGDVMLGRLMNQALERFGPAYPWGDVTPLLARADLSIVNLECVIATCGRPWTRWPKVFHFRADTVAIDALKLAGIDCVTLANNHVLDFEEPALFEMLDLLDQAGIAHTGAGRNLDEARRPAVLEAGGLRVGVVAFTDNEPGWAATASSPGTSYIPIELSEQSLGPVREAIAHARAQKADVVLVALHWGPNMVQRPTDTFRDFAHRVIEAGADVLLGHSAHVFQGIEIERGRPIIYDAGDFVDDYAVDPELRNDWGLLFRLEVEPAGVRRIELTPVLISACQVRQATGHERQEIARRMERLSREMGTLIHRGDDRLWVECPPPRLPAKTS